MALLPLRKKLFPEEEVRRSLIEQMVSLAGYPRELIAIEKELSLLPDTEGAPKRRLDILVYGPETKPLLLVECKAVPLDQKTIDQVIGYNHHVKAPFVAICNQDEMRTGWYAEEGVKWKQGLFAYKDLLDALR